MRYVVARFPGVDLGLVRLGGPGLGNLLFFWARALVRSIQTGAHLLPPVWHQIKVGPWIRREADKRSYFDVFPARPISAVWTEWVRCRLFGNRVLDLDASKAPPTKTEYEIVADGRPTFHDLEPHRDAIKAALLEAARPSVIPRAQDRPVIAVHVRLGDFARPAAPEARVETNTSLPIDWYLRAIEAARRHLGSATAPVTVFSDGTDAELAKLASVDMVERARRATALSDIMKMSSASALICSNSTFSLWAIFLGQSLFFVPERFVETKFFSRSFVGGRLTFVP